MKKKLCIITIVLVLLSACSSTRLDPFKFVKVVRIDDTSFQLIYSTDAPTKVIKSTYSINTEADSIKVIFAQDNDFSRVSTNIKLKDIFSVVSQDQTREYLISGSKLPSSTGFTECSRSSLDQTYPIFFGLNLVYFIPRKTDITISDISVFSNIMHNGEEFVSIDANTWMFFKVINTENPIIGKQRFVNQEKTLALKHTLELNSYTCREI